MDSSAETEATLRRTQGELEAQVEKRTEQLAWINEQLRIEISERKRIEAALRESREQLQGVLSALYETFVVVYDYEGRHLRLWGPPELYERYGLDYQDVIGRKVPELFPGAQADRTLANIRHVFETGACLRVEFMMSYPGGDFWHDMTLSPMRGPAGETVAVRTCKGGVRPHVYRCCYCSPGRYCPGC